MGTLQKGCAVISTVVSWDERIRCNSPRHDYIRDNIIEPSIVDRRTEGGNDKLIYVHTSVGLSLGALDVDAFAK